MFAVIRTGGKQHRVVENDRITVERLPGAPGDVVAFSDVLMLGSNGSAPLVGATMPQGARVFGEVVAQKRSDKVLVFKKKRRKNHRRLNGHRQYVTVVRIASISATGKAPEVTATAASEVAESGGQEG
jgi:large subunit ribosomal protein L21